MLAIKRLVTILVMVFVLLGLLLIFVPAVQASFADMFSNREAGLYHALFITAIILLALQLITENLDSVLLRREVALHNGKINELKAKLYDQQSGPRDRDSQPRAGMTTALPPIVPAEPTRPAPDVVNDPLNQSNSIIHPSPASDPTNRPAL